MPDDRMRELTYKLINMAPEAPPFPEEPVTQLNPNRSDTHAGSRSGPPPRRRTWIAAAAGAFALVLLVALPLLWLTGGDDEPGDTGATTTVLPATEAPTSTAVPTTTIPPTDPVDTELLLYFMADYVESSNTPGPHLVPVSRIVPIVAPDLGLDDQLGAAIVALVGRGPVVADEAAYPGISSAIPEGTELLGFSISNGTATLDFNAQLEAGGGTFSMAARLAQIVYTATQFPEIDNVELEIDGAAVDVFSSEGIILDGPQSRADHRDLLPLVFVETPLANTTVASPISVTGLANTFEAGIQYRIETRDGTLLADGFSTATCGTGCWGDVSFTAGYALPESASGYLVLFESSARDGRPVNVVRVPVMLSSAEDSTEGLYLEVAASIQGGPGVNGAFVVEPELTLTGYTNAGAELTVNAEPVVISNELFEVVVLLQPGLNDVEFVVGPLRQIYAVTYVPNGSVEFAFVEQAGSSELVADYAQWLTGEEANRAAIEDGEIAEGETVPNDYYIRNQNPQLRTLAVSEDVVVWLPTPAFGGVDMIRVPLEVWLDLFKDDGSSWVPDVDSEIPAGEEPHWGFFGAGMDGASYWLTLDADGRIVQIVGQYRP